MTKKYFTRLLQASLMCCLAVLFTACEDFATEDNPTPSYISINTSTVQLKLGDTFVRKAVVAGTAVVEYSSSDETIATVDQEGKVTGIAAGTATITAQATGYNAAGKKIYIPEEKSYKVTVIAPGLAYVRYTWDGTALSAPITDYATEYTKVTSSTTAVTWPAGTYVVEEDATITGNITLSGDVNLILCDGKTLTVNGKIDGDYNNYGLKIYGQSGGSGKLVATSPSDDALAMFSFFEIFGGDVQATSSQNAYGGIYGSPLNVYSGKLTAKNTATGTGGGYGIKTGYGRDINLYGGEVIAEGNGSSSQFSHFGIRIDDEARCLTVYPGAKLNAFNPDGDNTNYYAIKGNIKSGTSAVEFKFSSDGTTYSAGSFIATATATSSDAALKKNYCKVGYE